MSTITKSFTFSAGGLIIASDHNSNYDTIYNDYNGSISNVNLASNASIVDTKLAQITTSQKVNLTALVATSQATGDTIYASSATVMSRLAAGTSGQFLKQGASIPAWAFAFAKSKLITFTRDQTASSGNVAYTGMGFTPSALVVVGFESASTGRLTIGFAESIGSTKMSTGANEANARFGSSSVFIYSLVQSDGNGQTAVVNSYDSDGFTLAWTKNGSPSASTYTYYVLGLG